MTDHSEAAIGVFDSGVGGLTALRKLAEILPHEHLIYLGDTARVPYGNRPPATICLYAQQCTRFLLEHTVKFILVACNSVCAVALPLMQSQTSVPVVGVIEPAVNAALQKSRHGRIGIIGTRATIQSRAYELELRSRGKEVVIVAAACPLFVPLVEEGWHDHPATYAIAQAYLAPLIEAKVDTVILGCTHYPLLRKVIEMLMPEVCLIDSGEEAAIALARWVSVTKPRLSDGIPRTVQCFVTDAPTPSTMQLMHDIFGLPAEIVCQTSIEGKITQQRPAQENNQPL